MTAPGSVESSKIKSGGVEEALPEGVKEGEGERERERKGRSGDKVCYNSHLITSKCAPNFTKSG